MNDSLNAQLSRLVTQVDETEQELIKLDEQIAEKKRTLEDLVSKRIPDLMDQMETAEVVTTAGLKVKIEPFVAVSILKDRKDEALAWLEANGHGGIVKREVTAEFRAGDKEAKRLFDQLLKRKTRTCKKVSLKEGVHDQTMKALGRELIEAGQLFPDSFSVYTGRKAKITQPKAKK